MSRESKAAWLLAAGVLAIYLAFLPPSFFSWDGGGMLQVAVSIVEKFSITVPPMFGAIGRGGHYYARWYPLLSVLAIPFVALGLLVSHLLRLPQQYCFDACALLLSVLIATGNAAATTLLARRLGASGRMAALAGIAMAFGTVGLAYARNFYADPLLALVVTLALLLAFGEGGNPGWVAALCALAILAKPTGIVLIPVLFVYARLRRRSGWNILAGGAAGSLLFAGYDYLRFGNVFRSGQPNFWNLRHAPVGWLGLLVSPGVGLLVYSPVVLLALSRRARRSREGASILALTALFVLLYGTWGLWWSSAWGPRFLLPVIPALLAMSALTRHRKLWLALALAGLVIQLPTAVSTPERYMDQLGQRGISPKAIMWNPAKAPVTAIWASAGEQFRAAAHFDVRRLRRHHAPSTSLATARLPNIVPLWWWVLPMFHLSRWWGIAAAILLVAAGIFLLRRSVQLASETGTGAAPAAGPVA